MVTIKLIFYGCTIRSVLLCELYSTVRERERQFGVKLVGARMHFAACRSLARTEQTNLTTTDHPADPSLSSPDSVLTREQMSFILGASDI